MPQGERSSAPVHEEGRFQSSLPVETITVFLRSERGWSAGAESWAMVMPAMAEFSGWTDGELFVRGGFNHFADANDVARFVGSEVEAQRRGVGDDVEHSAVGDIHFYRAEAGNFDVGIEVDGERGNILKRDAFHFFIFDFGFDFDQAGGSIELELHDALADGNHSGFEQHGDDADGVGAGHRRVFGLLHDDESGGGFGICGRQDEIAVGRGVAARFAQH